MARRACTLASRRANIAFMNKGRARDASPSALLMVLLLGLGACAGGGKPRDAAQDFGSSTGGTAGGGGTGGGGTGGLDGGGGTGGVADAAADIPAGTGGTGGTMDAGIDLGGHTDGPGPEHTPATGVVVLSVPLTGSGQMQLYNELHNNGTNPPLDLSNQTITVRAYAPGALGGELSIFFSSGVSPQVTLFGVSYTVELTTLAGDFVDIPVPVPVNQATMPEMPNFDPTMVSTIRLQIQAGSSSTFQSPATIVYIDSVTSSGGTLNDTFDTNPTTSAPALVAPTGVTTLQVANSMLSWQMTLP
jgi:hypothetical protein